MIHGNQARELVELIQWLKTEKPDLICLSNAMLIGMARRLKSELGVPVLCSLQGEDFFLDSLPQPHRDQAWQIIAERATEIDRFIAPSQYYGELMRRRLRLPADQVRVLYNGIDLEGYSEAKFTPEAPVVGFFARMCREKGLDTLVEAFLLLKKRVRVKNLKLRVGGYCGPADRGFVDGLQERLKKNGFLADAEFCPNLTRLEKQEFLRSLTVFSVPATYGEAFGLYVIEALAAGVPVVQPDHAAFPELIAATGGGLLCKPNDPSALADTLESLLLDPARRRTLGNQGCQAVREKFGIQTMAAQFAELAADVLQKQTSG